MVIVLDDSLGSCCDGVRNELVPLAAGATRSVGVDGEACGIGSSKPPCMRKPTVVGKARGRSTATFDWKQAGHKGKIF